MLLPSNNSRGIGPKPACFRSSRPRSDQEGIVQAADEQRAVLATLEACVASWQGAEKRAVADKGHSKVAASARRRVGASLDISSPHAIADMVERDRRCVWHPYTSLREPDLPLLTVGDRRRVPRVGRWSPPDRRDFVVVDHLARAPLRPADGSPG